MNDTALSDWLLLREAADARSRSAALTQLVIDRLPRDRTVSVVDLGTGAGSNFRYLMPRLSARQSWLMVDRSERLLDDLLRRTSAWASTHDAVMRSRGKGHAQLAGLRVECDLELRAQNLASLDDRTLFAGRDLVTASALLDLVSEQWLQALAAQCRGAGAAVLITITYDGRFSCEPREPEDELVRECMNTHQLRDKGLGGPAEGPRAAQTAERCLVEAGYRVATSASDWVIGPDERGLQRVLIDGWAAAATEVAPAQTRRIGDWHARRLAHVEAGRSRVVVGHRDLAAWR